ncbi:MAG: NYN domain-containing protein [Fimbriimonadaceae bacterium]|nr:NYN domain-containing protein [Fimbriimonadaceae bacterium]
MNGAQARVALFLDAENFRVAATDSNRVFYYEHLLNIAREQGVVVLARAYADWTQGDMKSVMTQLHEYGVLMEQMCTSHHGKNTADMQLAADALELCLSDSQVETVIIASGDRDMVPLVHKLKRRAITVIGIGFRNNTGKTLSNVCTQFYFYEDLVAALTESLAEEAPAPSYDLGKARDLLLQAMDLIVSQGKTTSQSLVNTTMKQLDPSFSHNAAGFSSFGAFVACELVAENVEISGKSGMDNVIARKQLAPSKAREHTQPSPPETPEDLVAHYQSVLLNKGVQVLPREQRAMLVFGLVRAIQTSSEEGMTLLAMNSKLEEIALENGIEAPPKAIHKISHTLNIGRCFAHDLTPAYEPDLNVALTLAVPDAEEAKRRLETTYVGALLIANLEPDPKSVALWLYGSEQPADLDRARRAIQEATRLLRP